MKRLFLYVLLIPVIALYSCGGGGGSGGGGSSPGEMTPANTGDIALFVTDNLSDYNQVLMTIIGVEIINKGSGTSCVLLSTPVENLDIPELVSELRLLNIERCPEGSYNRIILELSRNVSITKDTASDECAFVSYKDKENKPNVLHCSGDTCTLAMNGMVNSVMNNTSNLTLDFDLKEFEAEHFDEPSSGCTVTMKVEPLNANGIEEKKREGRQESVKGVIADLNSTQFILERKGDTFTVVYGGVAQPGIGDLLELAEANGLKTKVLCLDFDLATSTCTASEIAVEAEGAVSELNGSALTFVLTFNPSISVDYSGAVVEGILTNDAAVEVYLYGFADAHYLAYEVEVEEP